MATTEITVFPDGSLTFHGRTLRCAVGRSGIVRHKVEGDGATPAGSFPLRSVMYRPDRLPVPPHSKLPVRVIEPTDGWCDDPADPSYNRRVRLPYPARCEALWRDDGLYDLLCVIGYNDDPPEPGRGSAIFMHVAAPDFTPTEGCVALALSELCGLLNHVKPGDRLVVASAHG